MKRSSWLAVLALGAGFFSAGAGAARAASYWPEGLTSGEPAGLVPFYERTLGWTSEPEGKGDYDAVIFLRAGRAVARISHRAVERGGARGARWLPVFAGQEPEGVKAAMLETGGGVLEQASAENEEAARGEIVWMHDAEGAVFGLKGEPGARAGAEPRGVWAVLLARDTGAAAEFYRSALGGETRPEGRTPLFAGDFLLENDGRAWAGVQPCGSFGRAGWLVLFSVGDIESATKAARREGGRILRAPELDLIGGRVAVIADPAGGVFGLYEALPIKTTGREAGGGRGAAAAYEVEALP